MRFKPDWPAPAHVTDVSVWPWRRLRKTAAAWGPRGFWEVESLFFFFSLTRSFFSPLLKKKKSDHVVAGEGARLPAPRVLAAE